MSSIVDFSSLSSAVANWMARTGNADFTGNVGDFIALFEADLNYGFEDPQFPIPPLRCAQMEVAQTTLTVLNSTNTVGLPPDFLEMRRLYQTGNPSQKLTYVTPNQMDSTLNTFPAGPQEFYTIIGGAIYLAANVNTTQTLVGGYFQKLPPLSSSNTVNWLITADPWLYMSGALMKAALFVGDDDGAAKWGRIVSGKVRAFNKQDTKARYGGDALQIKTDVGNP